MLNTEMEEQKVSQEKALAETIEKHAEELKDQSKYTHFTYTVSSYYTAQNGLF